MNATMSEIRVRCACGKVLRVTGASVGKRAKCPGCANVFTVPTPPKRDRTFLVLGLLLLAALFLPLFRSGKGAVFFWTPFTERIEYGWTIWAGILAAPLAALLILPSLRLFRRPLIAVPLAFLAGAAGLFGAGVFASEMSSAYRRFLDRRCKLNLTEINLTIRSTYYPNRRVPERIGDLGMRPEQLSCVHGTYELAPREQLVRGIHAYRGRVPMAWHKPRKIAGGWGAGPAVCSDGTIIEGPSASDEKWEHSTGWHGVDPALAFWFLVLCLAAVLGLARVVAGRADRYPWRVALGGCGILLALALVVPVDWGGAGLTVLTSALRVKGVFAAVGWIIPLALLAVAGAAALGLVRGKVGEEAARRSAMIARIGVAVAATVFAVFLSVAEDHVLVGLGLALRVFVPVTLVAEAVAAAGKLVPGVPDPARSGA
ncbi:MAG: hypothetical protein HYY17_14375 [Planctomycetes bacterium]|nr:hypothetical protein [Planctomycetota bacterium]